ncbi:hypothetical protein B0H16DRAFT_1460462 [Mycena metata]|uniref:Uncharacterized protein n=1 Tax=Mycena metata TaxID=1033252 RepID=A0AAD7IX42_9AGAR|nr:hypothetical protein B0H16DRAFT_1460462 [Mycena metata]
MLTCEPASHDLHYLRYLLSSFVPGPATQQSRNTITVTAFKGHLCGVNKGARIDVGRRRRSGSSTPTFIDLKQNSTTYTDLHRPTQTLLCICAVTTLYYYTLASIYRSSAPKLG